MKRVMLACLLLCLSASAQLKVQVQNGGTPVGTYSKWLPLNLVNGGCVQNATTGALDCTFAAPTSVALSGLTNPGANKAFDMTTRTLNFNFTGNFGTDWGYSISSSGANASTGYLFKVSTGAGSNNKVVSFLNGAGKGLYIDADGLVRITDQLYLGGHRMNFTDLAAGNLPIGTYYVDMAEIAAPANPAAGTCRFWVDSTTHQITFRNSAGTSCIASGTGTVTNTGGALTLNSLMLGAGTNDAKVMAADPTNCSAGQAPTGIDKTGAAKGCFTPSGALPAGVSSDGANGLAVTGKVAAASIETTGTGAYVSIPDGGTAGANKFTSAAGAVKWGTLPVTQTIAKGSLALATNSIASGSCQTVTAGSVNSAAATGVVNTDVVVFTANGSLKAVTGYVPATTGGLTIAAYPTAGYVNFDVCNWTAGAVVPGAVTINWQVTR